MAQRTDRRAALLGLAAICLGQFSGCGGGSDDPDLGDQTCNASGIAAPRAGVDLSGFYQRAAQLQQANMWCWAACISMVFAYRGHPVQQARIVSTVYGGLVDLPAIGLTIASALNRIWIDDRGVAFRASVNGLFDVQSGILALTNDQIVNSLLGGTPLLIGGTGHARVLVAVNYQPTPFGTSIVGGTVFDPATGAAQCLSVSEMTPTPVGGSLAFLASVSIT